MPCDIPPATFSKISKAPSSLYDLYLKSDKSLYIYNLNSLVKSYKIWKKLLPEITPYYAVKCNPDIEVLRKLADLEVCFDCASPNEISTVLQLNIDSDRIIYANPCKTNSDIEFAKNRNIRLTTFDSISELEKMANQGIDLVMRIYASDETAQCILSNKYGCYEEEWTAILQKAKDLQLNIVGISFHIGSGAANPEAYSDALEKSRKLYDLGITYGYTMNLIDIGGGFSYKNIAKMSKKINLAKEKYFSGDFKFIAEPGRYFAENVATFYTKVIGVRHRRDVYEYYINESAYGSFNCIIYDHTILQKPRILNSHSIEEYDSILYGNTCDGGDTIATMSLPKLKVGDWLIWDNFGAYTIAGACDFNGIILTKPNKIYI